MRLLTEQQNFPFRSIVRATSSTVPEVVLPEGYEAVLADGWAEVRAAWVLPLFARGYAGTPSDFSDLTGFEAAANGRAVPEDGLARDAGLPAALAARGLTFARLALLRLPESAPPVTAFVSVGRTAFDESTFTGSVTFCADHAGERRYIRDIERFDDGIATIRSVRSVRRGDIEKVKSTRPT